MSCRKILPGSRSGERDDGASELFRFTLEQHFTLEEETAGRYDLVATVQA